MGSTVFPISAARFAHSRHSWGQPFSIGNRSRTARGELDILHSGNFQAKPFETKPSLTFSSEQSWQDRSGILSAMRSLASGIVDRLNSQMPDTAARLPPEYDSRIPDVWFGGKSNASFKHRPKKGIPADSRRNLKCDRGRSLSFEIC